MNLIPKFLRARRIVSIPESEFLKNAKSIKCSAIYTQKFSRILSSSGCVIAGCFFSKQSVEEVLIRKKETCYIAENLNVPHFETRGSGACGDTEDMKRNVEHIDETISTNSNNDSQSVYVSEPESKRTKTDHDFETTSQNESVKHSPVQDAIITRSAEWQKKKGKAKTPKQRPNYFVAVQISNDEIRESLHKVQDRILLQEERLEKSMISLKTLHITLMVMYIGDPETNSRAKKALHNVYQEYDDDLSKNPLQLEFKGLSHFQNKVVYAKVSNEDASQRLSSLAQSVKEHFAAYSLFTTDTKDRFTPHLTVAKIDFKNKYKGVNKINPLFYKDYVNEYFGSQTIESIQLLSMTNPKNEAGYYSGEELFFSAFKPKDNVVTLGKMLSIEDQKKDIKDTINKLMKEKLK